MPCAVTSTHSKDGLNGALFTSTLGQVSGNCRGETELASKDRVILPLQKSHRQGQSPAASGQLGSPQSTASALPNAIPGVDVTGRISQHTHILYLRIEDCRLVGQVEAESLRSLGVLDVIWW